LPDAPGMVSVGEFAFRTAMKVALTALRATWRGKRPVRRLTTPMSALVSAGRHNLLASPDSVS
jgi:hypothetical protein